MFPLWKGPPSSEYWYGAVPPAALLMVMEPSVVVQLLGLAGTSVAVMVTFTFRVTPGNMAVQPLASLTVTW